LRPVGVSRDTQQANPNDPIDVRRNKKADLLHMLDGPRLG